jgi:predicted dehydrogenase
MSDLGWGILATGGIAGNFTEDLQEAGLRVAAVGSRTQDRADAFSQRYGIPHAHGSWEALVADPDVDVVYVATPHSAHASAALLALDAGKHVLVEKPFTINAAEAREVVERAEQRGLVVLEAMWTRWLPHMLEIHELLADGAIGEPQTLIATHNQDLPKDPEHRMQNPDLGGGALLDLGIYPISFAVDVFGLPERIEAVATFTPTGVDERVSGVLEHEGGKHSLFTTALNIAAPNRATILGTGGRIEIDPTWQSPTSYTVYDAKDREVRRSRPEVSGRGMQHQAFELERLVREGAGPGDRLPPAESVAIMGVLDRIRSRIGLVYPQEDGGSSAG